MTKELLLPIALPVGLIFGGFLIGLIAERIFFKRLKKIVEKTKWTGDDVIISSLKGNLVL